MKRYIGTKIVEAAPSANGYRVRYEDGYESWSPKDVFEKAYRPVDGMNFGLAIEAAKRGAKITRAGWNGKGMWVVYRTGYPEGIPCNKNTADAVGIPEGSLFKVRPYLQMKCVDGSFQMWLASQSDLERAETAKKTLGNLHGDIWNAIKDDNDESVIVHLNAVGSQAMDMCVLLATIVAEANRAAEELADKL